MKKKALHTLDSVRRNGMTNKKILIIEDDAAIRDLLAEFLALEGFEVAQAVNGLDALEQLQQMQTLPDLVLLDVMMPVMDGLSFFELIKSSPRFNRLKLIMMSANPQLVSKSVREQVEHFLVKPINLSVLLGLVDQESYAGRSEAAC
jgi:two-component system, chemotaxis family, chemotaxis protein CheY